MQIFGLFLEWFEYAMIIEMIIVSVLFFGLGYFGAWAIDSLFLRG